MKSVYGVMIAWYTMSVSAMQKSFDVKEFYQHIYNHDYTAISQILDKYPQAIDAYDAERNTALHIAAETNSEAIIQLLIDKKKELLEARNNIDETPLFNAVIIGYEVSVKVLIRAGADVNAVKMAAHNGKKYTPVELAKAVGHKAIVALLMQAQDEQAL